MEWEGKVVQSLRKDKREWVVEGKRGAAAADDGVKVMALSFVRWMGVCVGN